MFLPQIGKRSNKKTVGHHQPAKRSLKNVEAEVQGDVKNEAKHFFDGVAPITITDPERLTSCQARNYKDSELVLDNITDTNKPWHCGPDYVRTCAHNFKLPLTAQALRVNKKTFPKLQYGQDSGSNEESRITCCIQTENYDYLELKKTLLTTPSPFQTEITNVIIEYLQEELINPCSIYCTMLDSCESCIMIKKEEERSRAIYNRYIMALFQACLDDD
jgi:hypothetical protein